jgi:hypothetical protein
VISSSTQPADVVVAVKIRRLRLMMQTYRRTHFGRVQELLNL